MQPYSLVTLQTPSLASRNFRPAPKTKTASGLLSTSEPLHFQCALMHTEMSSKLVRRPTDPELRRARDVFRRPSLPSEQRGDRVQDKFASYDDFPWEQIEEFLKQKWPAWTSFNPTRVCHFLLVLL
jgi:hypothetical protein